MLEDIGCVLCVHIYLSFHFSSKGLIVLQLPGEPRDHPWPHDAAGHHLPRPDQHPQHHSDKQPQGKWRSEVN